MVLSIGGLGACSRSDEKLVADAGTDASDAGTDARDAGSLDSTSRKDSGRSDGRDDSQADVKVDAVSDGALEGGTLSLVRRFPTATNPGVQTSGCTYASPVAIDDNGIARIAIADGSGLITAIDPSTGASVWSTVLPARTGEQAFVVATPLVLGNLLVVAYHTVATGTAPLTVTAPRLRHRIAVVDIAAHALSAAYPPFDLTADVQGPMATSRSCLDRPSRAAPSCEAYRRAASTAASMSPSGTYAT